MAKGATKKPISATRSAKSATKQPNSEINPSESIENQQDICSISALARRFDLDRATVRTKIEKAGIKAVSEKAKEKLYLLDERLESVLREDEMEAAKLRKTEAEARLREIDVQKKLGEFGSVAEFTEITQQIFSRLYKKLAVQMPGRIAPRLHNANSSGDVAALLKHEISKEFDALRSDFTKYL